MLRVNAAMQRRLDSIQTKLLLARQASAITRETLADDLGIAKRTLRDWETCYDSPSLAHALNWASRLGYQLTLADRLGKAKPEPVAAEGEAPWELREMRRLTPPLKSRREARKISQEDLALIIGVARSTLRRWEDGEQLSRLIALIVWSDRLDFTLDLEPRPQLRRSAALARA
ncbi:helix-turn-helix transcriptional regulator [Catenulispora yoronensis]|uniref:helix-turn-helix transcriptional regulator n=1 Tax=Catenulispora yoronensis TaxID=450799 RepID=UPI0031D917E9